MPVHRVVDAEVNNLDGICYIYTRLHDGSGAVVKIMAVYDIVIGIDGPYPALATFVANVQGYHRAKVRVTPLGMSQTYYRGSAGLVHVTCEDYRTYSSVLRSIKYDGHGRIYTCGGYSTLEDSTLLYYGLHASLYIVVEGKEIRPARPEETFPYTPKVGSLDFEMLSLNYVDPECEVYMGAYCDGEVTVIIYTSRYLPADIPDHDGRRYIRAYSKADLMVKLSEVIDQSKPDIITGYNIYNADVPLIYYTLRRTMSTWYYSRPGPRPYFHNTRRMVKGYSDSDAGVSLKIPGTHMVDMYPYLEGILSRDDHKSMRLGDISSHFLGADKDPLSYKDLERIYYEGTYDEKHSVMVYCAKDAELALRLYRHFGVWEFHSAMYSICGVSPDRLMSKGMVEITYGMCNRRALAEGVYMDQPNNPIFKPSGGLVIESKDGHYDNVYCIDVESMYPNICIQHNVDSSTHVALSTLDLALAVTKDYYMQIGQGVDVLLDSRGSSHGFIRTYNGILPLVLKGLLDSRRRVKTTMGQCTDPIVKAKLDARQLALKFSANSGCGAYGEQTPGNPMSDCIINDIITTTGRRILSYSLDLLEGLGAEVIYGDTDSLFITYDGDMGSLIDSLHEALPSGIRFKLEYKASKFIMGKKKHYLYRCGDAVRVVGYKGDKSSSCRAVQMAFKNLATLLLDEGPEETIAAYDELVRNCCNEPNLDVNMFSWRIGYSGKTYSEVSHKHMLMECMRARGIEFAPGNTIDVTIVMTELDYAHKYGRDSGMRLPRPSARRYETIYSLEEIGDRSDVIDVEAIFDSQCKSVLTSMIGSYMKQR